MKSKWDKLLEGIEPAIQEDKQLTAARKTRTDHKSEKNSDRKQKSVSSKTWLDSDAELSANEESYLRIVSSHPWRTPMEIYARLNDEKVMGNGTMSQATSVKTRKELIRKEYLLSFDVLGTGRSGKMQCDVVTEKTGMGNVKHPRGDLLHSFWIYRVAENFRRQGAKVKIAETISGHEVDIGVEIDD